MECVRSNGAKFGFGLVLLLGAAIVLAPRAAASDSVTYVESVDCVGGTCAARLRTEPLTRTVRERLSGGMCLEYVRQIAGMKKVPTVDPRTPIELPQYQDSPSRHVRCDQSASAGKVPVATLDPRARN